MRPFLRILLISALTLIGLVLAYVALFARFTPAESSSGSSAAGSISAPRTFYTSAYFGGIGGGARWPKPPAGPHALRGRILLDSKPAAGVELELALNGRFNTGRVTSDANGDFAWHLPEGTWTLNSINARDWPARPKNRDLKLFSGHERPAGLSRWQYSSDVPSEDRGLNVQLPVTDDSVVFNLELRDVLKVVWPPRQEWGDHSAPTGTLEGSTIVWQPVPNATHYEVQFDRVTREGRTTYYTHTQFHRQKESALPLSRLTYEPSDTAAPEEYAVKVFAFDAQDRLITSNEDGDYSVFRLGGGARLRLTK